MPSFVKAALPAAALQASLALAGEPLSAAVAAQQITRAGEQSVLSGSAEFFSGQVRIEPIWPSAQDITASAGLVTFEAGAHSAWHTHPGGQRLLVMSGVGLTQEWGKPVQVIRAGDVVHCPPGVKHWHGAAPDSAMTHLAVTGMVDGQNVIWMEHVTDEQYNAAREAQ